MSGPIVVEGVEGLEALVGKHLGHSDWERIEQARVDRFAEATGDHQWIHVDPDRAADGPFGGTIAHGYLTLAMVPLLVPQILRVEGFAMGINYGCNRVRFPAPVSVGSRIRAGLVLDEVTRLQGGVQNVMTVTMEIDGGAKPACVAEIVVRRYLPDGGTDGANQGS